MIYLFLIPIFVIFTYGGILLIKNYKQRALIILVTISILYGSFYLLIQNYLETSIALNALITFEIITLFIILHLKNKASIFFTILLFITISGIFVLGMFFEDTDIYLAFLSALIFFLAEDNQLFMRKSYEESANEYQNKILNKQVEEVQNIYITMRGWRHDYHNHLQKLKAHIKLGQTAEANEYLNELEIDLDNVNQLVESGNINLDAILNSKISLALKNNINVNYKANVPKKLTVSDIDLCVLIGNLIDNAVEACEKIKSNSDKFIRIYIGVFKKQLYISVSNATNELVRKLDEEYITTKRGNHGHGLKRINNIVEKYEGYINRKNEPGVFVSEVMLPL